MKNITKRILFCAGLFAILPFMGAVGAEEKESIDELRERLDVIMEKTEEMVEIVEEMRERGELPLEVEKSEESYENYLETYIKYGGENDKEEVEKLQTFLNDHMDAGLPVTGVYGEMTLEAVKNFQREYAEDILEPWGITEPTGYVYKTTQRKINDINYPGATIPVPELEEEEPGETVTEWDSSPMEEPTIIGDDVSDTDKDMENGEDVETPEDENLLGAELGETGDSDRDSLTWTVLILAAIGLGATVYYIYNGDKTRPNQQTIQS